MKIYRKQAVTIGILFLVAMGSYMIGSELVISSLNNMSNFVDINKNLLQIGIVLEFINSAAVVAIAALLHPILKTYDETASVIYVASRAIEAVLLLICSACALLLTLASPQAVQSIGTQLLAMRELLFQIAMITLGAGSIFMCRVFFNARLIPRHLAAIGIIGYIALTFSGFLGLFGYTQFGMMLFVPGALFEVAFPLWLFWKGFRPKISSEQLARSL